MIPLRTFLITSHHLATPACLFCLIVLASVFLATLSPGIARARAWNGDVRARSATRSPFIQGDALSAVSPCAAEMQIAAADVNQDANAIHYSTPPDAGVPTVVEIGLCVNEILAIDPSTNSFRMDALLDLTWCDPRLAFSATEAGVTSKRYLEADAQAELERIWWPDIELVNEKSARSSENEELVIAADGTVRYREKFVVELATNFDMHRFPFDSQTLKVEIKSFAWSSDALTFQVKDDAVGFSTEFWIPEWSVTAIDEKVIEKQEGPMAAPFHELVAEVGVQRDPGFYLLKVIIPLIFIVLASFAALWVDAEALGERLGVVLTGLLTAAAYQFVISEFLLAHIYNTYIDAMIMLAFILLILTIGENVMVAQFYRQERAALGNRLDGTARWLLPLIFLLMALALALIYYVV